MWLHQPPNLFCYEFIPKTEVFVDNASYINDKSNRYLININITFGDLFNPDFLRKDFKIHLNSIGIIRNSIKFHDI